VPSNDKHLPQGKPQKVPDPRMIEMDKAGEKAFWTKWFGVSDDELEDAIRTVGNSAQAVGAFLAARGKPRS
jgi:uncharacterized protein DUF3606